MPYYGSTYLIGARLSGNGARLTILRNFECKLKLFDIQNSSKWSYAPLPLVHTGEQFLHTIFIKYPWRKKMNQNENCPKKGFEIFMQSAQEIIVPPPAPIAGRGTKPCNDPPNYIPNPEMATKNINNIRRSFNKHCFFWLNKGQQFWFFPSHINDNSISGFRWLNRHWVHTGFEVDEIEAFYCSGM